MSETQEKRRFSLHSLSFSFSILGIKRSSVGLRVRSPDQPPQRHLGTCQKCKCSTPPAEAFGVRAPGGAQQSTRFHPALQGVLLQAQGGHPLEGVSSTLACLTLPFSSSGRGSPEALQTPGQHPEGDRLSVSAVSILAHMQMKNSNRVMSGRLPKGEPDWQAQSLFVQNS